MQEIEILVELKSSLEEAKRKLRSFEFKGAKTTLDIYFYDPLRDNLKPDADNKLLECCRIRQKADKSYITYKVDIYDGHVWSYSDEYETEIENYQAGIEILSRLGLVELVRIDSTKHVYKNENYEIVLEEVQGLGNFLEVEAISAPNDRGVADIKLEILDFISGLDIDVGEELNSGKPELKLRNQVAPNRSNRRDG